MGALPPPEGVSAMGLAVTVPPEELPPPHDDNTIPMIRAAKTERAAAPEDCKPTRKWSMIYSK
jgi:hypothetical protein